MSAVEEKAKINAPWPEYLVVEGPIGVGKTTLARKLADSFDCNILLEGASANPFLEKFYEKPEAYALPTQLHFLLQRTQELNELKQSDLFNPIRVADYLLEKDRIFAEITLNEDELNLYEQVYENLTVNIRQPDMVIYLQAPVEVLLDRIDKRGLKHERMIETAYLERICDAYVRFFYKYTSAPLLIVNAADIDFSTNDDDYQMLLEQILAKRTGRQYFNPGPVMFQNEM